VIPTAGEVPIVQMLQQFGLGGAGAATLLITLPAVSLPSLAMLGRALPMRPVNCDVRFTPESGHSVAR
jgi:uncharacterized protein